VNLETVLMQDGNLDEHDSRRYLQTVLRHTFSLSRRVSDVFELSNLQSGAIPFESDVFSLAELVHDIVGDYAPAHSKHHATVKVAADCEVPATVAADIGLLERALRNLLDNAIRHTPASGQITVRIDLDNDVSTKRYWLKVSDDGEGIDAECQPHVFESAWSGRQLSGRSVLGATRDADNVSHTGQRTGLGLHIVRQIALLHGGEPVLQSAPGQGTCIGFSLPGAPA